MTANKTKWVRLGDYIEAVDERNREGKYTVEDVRGVANTKGFIYTKANISDRDLSSFQVVNPTYFAFNRRTTRNGERLGLGYNDTHSTFICTEDYVVFKIKDEKEESYIPVSYISYFFEMNLIGMFDMILGEVLPNSSTGATCRIFAFLCHLWRYNGIWWRLMRA